MLISKSRKRCVGLYIYLILARRACGLGQLGIRWQPRPERRWLGNLWVNERAIRPILQFLGDTEVGSRDSTRERA